MIVFDFDGVICNSIYDSFLTALNAYIALFPDSGKNLAGPVEPASSVFAYIDKRPEIFRQFEQLMPLGNHADDYMVIFKIITAEATQSVQSQEDFYHYRDKIPEDLRKEYGRRFYKIRHYMQKNDPDMWVKLLPPFSEVVGAIHDLHQRYSLAIATAKDLPSVKLLLKEYDLVNEFSAETIFDKEAGTSKRNHMVLIQKRFDVPFEKLHFIDDKVSHLKSVADLGICCHLATWGFNDEREHELAKSLRFNLLTFDALQRFCFQ